MLNVLGSIPTTSGYDTRPVEGRSDATARDDGNGPTGCTTEPLAWFSYMDQGRVATG